MAGTPDQTDGQPTPPGADVFVSPDTTTDDLAEREKLALEIERRIQTAYDAVGLIGKGEDYRKQTLPDGRRERRFISRGNETGTIDYLLVKKGGGILDGSFSLGYTLSEDFIDSASANYHLDERTVEGKEAIELIDAVFADIFPERVQPTSDQTPPTEA